MPPRVFVTTPVPAPVDEVLRDRFTLVEQPLGCDGAVTTLNDFVDAEFLDTAGPSLRVVANYAVGVNNVDLDAAKERGVVVANTPDVLTAATAELTVALMLGLLRRLVEGDRLIRRGRSWRFSLEFMLGETLAGKTVLVIGPGRIGSAVGRLVEAFGANALYAGRHDDLRAALSNADVVSLHCPLNDETRGLIGERELASMRSTAVLVNTARGPIVSEAALVSALRSGVISGAALDVYEDEPVVHEGLVELENVVLCPHLGSATRDTRVAMGMLCVEALTAVLLEERVPANAVR